MKIWTSDFFFLFWHQVTRVARGPDGEGDIWKAVRHPPTALAMLPSLLLPRFLQGESLPSADHRHISGSTGEVFIFVVWSWWRTDNPNLSSAYKMINSNEENGKHLSQDPWMDSPKKHRHDFFPLRNVILGICSSSIATTNVSEKGLDRVIGRGEDLRSLLRRTKITSFS